VSRFDVALQIIGSLLRGERLAVSGRYYEKGVNTADRERAIDAYEQLGTDGLIIGPESRTPKGLEDLSRAIEQRRT
jgi:hypothetical protein